MSHQASAENLLRERGLRVTPQRQAVLQWLLDHGGAHLSADQVRDQLLSKMPGLARGTTYKVLDELVRTGLCEELATADGMALYGLRLEPHHHFYCESCHRWYDVQVEGLSGLRIAGAEPGTWVGEVDVTFKGTCQRCSTG